MSITTGMHVTTQWVYWWMSRYLGRGVHVHSTELIRSVETIGNWLRTVISLAGTVHRGGCIIQVFIGDIEYYRGRPNLADIYIEKLAKRARYHYNTKQVFEIWGIDCE